MVRVTTVALNPEAPHVRRAVATGLVALALVVAALVVVFVTSAPSPLWSKAAAIFAVAGLLLCMAPFGARGFIEEEVVEISVHASIDKPYRAGGYRGYLMLLSAVAGCAIGGAPLGPVGAAVGALATRQFHEAYNNRGWCEYKNSARAGKLSKYQFRDPGEDFAEVYATYHCTTPKGSKLSAAAKAWFEAQGLHKD